jgi:trehalose 6-phosphate synthase
MIQIAPPTREGLEAYDQIRRDYEQATGEVNGRFGDLSWTPIRYIHRPVPRPVIAGLFRRCRIALVTPLRDGMNLVAKEYIAAQDPADPGVLVLSQFAGAAEQLEDALIVNPHDPTDVAAAIRQGIEMPLGERQARHRALLSRVTDENVKWWRDKFLSLLAATSALPGASLMPQVRIKPEVLPYEEKPDTTTH